MFRPYRSALLLGASVVLIGCASSAAGQGLLGGHLPSLPFLHHDPGAKAETLGPVVQGPNEKVWPQTYADLPPDPAMRFGTLPNGLRYVIMHLSLIHI